MHVKIHQRAPDVPVPTYQTPGAACFDLHDYAPCAIPRMIGGASGSGIAKAATFQTGLSFEIPEGFVMLVFSRSGHGFKHDVCLANSVGVIDSDYRGEVLVRLTNYGDQPFTVKHGDRIAQAMIVPIPRVEFQVVDALSDTARGAGGFGSTGR